MVAFWSGHSDLYAPDAALMRKRKDRADFGVREETPKSVNDP
jgi:hypothetical protein